jgi:hypothetical protein
MKAKVQPQLDAGLHVSGDTLEWWMSNDFHEARTEMFKDAKHPALVINEFLVWYNKLPVKPECIWGHGSVFDIPILEAFLKAFSRPIPWGYRAARDTRTLFDIAGKKMGDYGTENIGLHNALMDSMYQVKEVCACWKDIQRKIRAGEPCEGAKYSSGMPLGGQSL